MGEPQSPRASVTKEDVSNLMNISKAVSRGKPRTSTTFLAMQESLRDKQVYAQKLSTDFPIWNSLITPQCFKAFE